MFDDINNISKSIQKEYNAPDKKDEFYRYITNVMSYPYYQVDIILEKFILVSKTLKGFWIKRKWDTEASFKNGYLLHQEKGMLTQQKNKP